MDQQGIVLPTGENFDDHVIGPTIMFLWLAGWGIAYTEDGRMYFLNHVHRTTHWERKS